MMKRRDFLKASAVTVAATGLAKAAHGRPDGWDDILKGRSGYPCLQLFTDEESAQFRILADGQQSLLYSAIDPNGAVQKLKLLSRTANPFTASAQRLDHLYVDGLTPGVDYRLEIKNSKTGALIDSRIFQTLRSSTDRAVNFAMVSCMHDWIPTQSQMWKSLEEMRPTMIFFIGDTCYTDWDSNGSMADHWRRNFETRQMLDIFWWKRLTPVMATWDDHDFGADNSNKTNPKKEGTKEAFKTMFGAVERPGLTFGPGVSSVMSLFGQKFCLLDGRYFRDPVGTENGLHWGDEQEAWLFDQIGNSTEPVWLMSGSQFFGAYLKKESAESDHPFQLKRMMERLATVPAPVVFGSGDIHFSELMKIEKEHLGYPTIEVTSSSMHSTTYPTMHRRAVNPRRITKAGVWQHNFVMVESEAAESGALKIRTRSIGMNRALYFDHSFEIVR
ncbi:MAG TPA: twin-arginine translocation signal domain-containing protein [Bdellovibrionales bacterium]|nr:twin-arginine translocation signal domain-containing protein [Bdellovibrionales bacterium]